MPGFVSPCASAVTENRLRPFAIRPLPNWAYRISEYPALQRSGVTSSAYWHVAYLTPYLLISLFPYAMCPGTFPDPLFAVIQPGNRSPEWGR